LRSGALAAGGEFVDAEAVVRAIVQQVAVPR
jgi:hypothetical protein